MLWQGKIIILLFTIGSLFIISCNKDPKTTINSFESLSVPPPGFPVIPFPDDNKLTKERWELGKRLFYEKKLSKSVTISCASCHLPQFAFSDTTAASIGDEDKIGRSNSPTLANVAYNPYYLRIGSLPTLEQQVQVPIQEHDEFNNNIVDIVNILKQDSSYEQQAQQAYNRSFDPFVLTRAIATFERTFISGQSAYDKYHFQGKKQALNDAQKRGEQLFFSDKTNCAKCHNGFNFTNYAFENNGLYNVYLNEGRKQITRLDEDEALFKVPTLRNIELTAPYMHDGSLKSLEAVVAHYVSGGSAFKNKSEIIKPLSLTALEKQDLVAFLKSLTDKEFVNNKLFKNEE